MSLKFSLIEKEARQDLEFMPTLLAIQESPPPKWPYVMLVTVAILFSLLFAWAFFGKLDVVATAEGRLVPLTWVKIVQPAEAGIVKKILVGEGQVVEAGQILMQMDTQLTDADARMIYSELAAKSLQLRRIDTELNGKPMQRAAEDPLDMFMLVSQQYAANRQTFLDTQSQEIALLNKIKFDLKAAQQIQNKFETTLPNYVHTASVYEKLGKSGFINNLVVEEKKREQLEKEQDLLTQHATVNSLIAMQEASQKKLAQISSSYQSSLRNERAEIDQALRKLNEEKMKILHKKEILNLRSPQAGIVKDLATHTPGTVVAPGTVLMSVVPQSEPLQAEMLLKNEDVGFISAGQQVQIKFAAYPFQKYGMINGIVEHVSPDAMEANVAKDGSANAGYRALVKLTRQTLELEGKQLSLNAGMQLVADIKLGRRTVMEYILSPVQKAWQEGGRER